MIATTVLFTLLALAPACQCGHLRTKSYNQTAHIYHEHPPVDHIVFMRFCLKRPGQEFNEHDCEQMLALFEATALKSLHRQNAHFHIIAYVDSSMPPKLLRYLERLLAPFPHLMASIDGFFEPGWWNPEYMAIWEHAQQLLNDYAASISDGKRPRIVTRLDVDDFVHRDLFKSVQDMHDYYRVNGYLYVNQMRGYRMVFSADEEHPGMLKCYLAPFKFPFLGLGQSLITDANSTHTLLNFEHQRERLMDHFLKVAGVDWKEEPAKAVAAFETLPFARGYIYVRHGLSHGGWFTHHTEDQVDCTLMEDVLLNDFGVSRSDVNRIAEMITTICPNGSC